MTDLVAELVEYGLRLRRSGLRAYLPGSEALFNEAFEAWKADPTNTVAEGHWRGAALVHGAALVARKQFAKAALTYTPTPSLKGGYVPATAAEYDVLAAMMAVGRSFALHMQNARYNGEAAERLSLIEDPRFNRWRGFVELLTIELYESTGGQRDASAALTLLDREQQPELYAIALHKTGRGNGRIGRWPFGTRRARYRPEECLYLFNE